MNCLVSDGEKYCGKPATRMFMRIPACDECVAELTMTEYRISIDDDEEPESKIPDPPSSQSGIHT